jgi:hypothetical protein
MPALRMFKSSSNALKAMVRRSAGVCRAGAITDTRRAELHWTYSCAASDTGQWTSTSESAQSLRKYAAYYARGYARDATFDPSALRADVWMAPAPGRAIEPVNHLPSSSFCTLIMSRSPSRRQHERS